MWCSNEDSICGLEPRMAYVTSLALKQPGLCTMANWFISTVFHSARLGTVLQILMFLPLTLSTISVSAFLILSFLLSIHSLIHGTLLLLWGSESLSFLQVPVHPFLLLVCFNLFSSQQSGNPWLSTAAEWWGQCLRFWTPIFIGLEGISSLLVAQSWGQQSKDLAARGEEWQFGLLVAAAAAYVGSATIIVLVSLVFTRNKRFPLIFFVG